MITIPRNDYSPNTEIRESVVQKICDVLLCEHVWHPVSEGAYRQSNNCVASWKTGPQGRLFADADLRREVDSYDFFYFNEAEMRYAWKELINAGYHIFRIYEYGTWLGYKLSKRDYMANGCEVKDFSERWT